MASSRKERSRDRQASSTRTLPSPSSIPHQSGSTSQIHLPKLLQIQFAQCLHHLIEYASELTYFAINAFQTSSLRHVQINTLLRFNDLSVSRTCAFYYNLDAEFEDFVKRMRSLCGLVKRTFLDLRVARIHFPNGRMMNLPIIRRTMEIFKCNISRLRDIKEIHQEIDSALLLPDNQLYLALDLLQTDFDLLNCELDAEIKFADAMILQTMIRDIFLQYRVALTWIYPAVKNAAYRPSDTKNIEEKFDGFTSKNIPWTKRTNRNFQQYLSKQSFDGKRSKKTKVCR